MKNLILVCFSFLVLISCQEEAGKTPGNTAPAADSSAIAAEQAIVNEMAAFYHGTMPCTDCDGIATVLTLNADEKRTFSMTEEYKGKENRTVESAGTWTVAGDVVTLTQQSGVSKYQVTADGLVSLNADGSKRDAESAKKYLLLKVLGE